MKTKDIRGFNYVPSSARNSIEIWRDYDPALIEKELSYAKRLNLNLARVFLSYVVYEREPEQFLSNLQHFVRTAWSNGIYTMPVVWDACFDEVQPTYDADTFMWVSNPGTEQWGEDFYPKGEQYCHALVEAMRDEDGIYAWDVMNEPTSNISIWYAEGEEKQAREQRLWNFVKHFCDVMHKADNACKITCGVAEVAEIPHIAEKLDVISFHDYSQNRAAIKDTIGQAVAFGEKYGKPILCTEMGCLARSNPYDVCIELYDQHGVGFVIWDFVISQSMWKDIHGVVYPDGTVRDPSTAAALMGFFRNRSSSAVDAYINKENHSIKIIAEAKALLCEEANPYDAQAYIDRVLVCAETIANQLECGQLVPMSQLPSSKVLALQTSCTDIPPAKALLHELCETLMKATHVM